MLNSNHFFTQKLKICLPIIYSGLLITSISGCAPSTYSVTNHPVTPPPLPSTEIYFQANYGQSEPQQQRDRYECHLWAVKKSGFDPNQAQLAPHQRFEVKPSPPPGTGVAIGAVGGAILGSMSYRRYSSPEGLVFGAITGALIGAATDVARHQEAKRIQQQYNENEYNHSIRLEIQARDYRRAISACLEGRRYTVQ